MNDQELRVYNETKLRNLQRKYSKLVQHPDTIEEAIECKAEIDTIKKYLEL